MVRCGVVGTWTQEGGYKGRGQVAAAGVRHGRHSESRPSTPIICCCSGDNLIISLIFLKISMGNQDICILA